MLTERTNIPAIIDLKQALQYIQSADLSSTEDRLTNIDNWPRKTAIQAVGDYRNYLYLRKKYSDQALTPSYEIDEAWHAHILHTREYTKFCHELFGYYLHHDPHIMGQKGDFHQLETSFELTQELHKKEFGDYLYQFKSRPGRIGRILKKIYLR